MSHLNIIYTVSANLLHIFVNFYRLQPSLVERLIVVDISPSPTSVRTNFRSYIEAMKTVKITSDIPRSTARRLAEDQLRQRVNVSIYENIPNVWSFAYLFFFFNDLCRD